MRNLFKHLTILAALWLCGTAAQAQSCAINAADLTSGSNYDPFATVNNDTAGIFSITCTRPKGRNNRFPAQFLVGATDGLNASAGTRRLRRGAFGDYLAYDLYRNYGGCSQPFGLAAGELYTLANSNTKNNDTTTNPNPLTGGTSYCFRITAGQNTAPPGTYTDTIIIGVGEADGTAWGYDTVTLSTTIVASCRLTSPPTEISLSYTSFASNPSTDTSSFQLRCTNTTTYDLGIDAVAATTAAGTLLGLNYTLGLSVAGGTGTALNQSYLINATVPPNQAGTCTGASCSATATHTLMISY